MTVILVCAAHPDDEILGAGATIARHVSEGDVVHSMIAAQGETSRGIDAGTHDRIESLRASSMAAARVLGTEAPLFLEFPDNAMDSVPLLEVIKQVESTVNLLAPELVYTHSPIDLNIDHRLMNQAVMTACRPEPGHPVKEIRFFETVSSTEWAGGGVVFRPTIFVDVSSTFELKLEALTCYENEMRDWPHPRSLGGISHLAHVRGSTIGVDAAEAFELGRRSL